MRSSDPTPKFKLYLPFKFHLSLQQSSDELKLTQEKRQQFMYNNFRTFSDGVSCPSTPHTISSGKATVDG